MKTKQVGVRRSARLRNKELFTAASKQNIKDGSSTHKAPGPSCEAVLPLDKSTSNPDIRPSKKKKYERVEVRTEKKPQVTEQELADTAVHLPHKLSHLSKEHDEKPAIHEICTEVNPAVQENRTPTPTSLEWRMTEKHEEQAAETEEMDNNNCLPTETSITTVLEDKEDIEKIENLDNDVERSDTMEIDQSRCNSFKVDNSIFLDEDSNQPMPVGKFFGNVEIMQDLPQSVPLLDSVTRREYRRRHFIAKDEEDEELEDRVTDETEKEPRVLPPSEDE
ncbi:UPF0688 protein C1orf174 homolog isoform X2 [Rhinoraja longicauda]